MSTKLDPWATICADFNRLETPEDKVNLFRSVNATRAALEAIANYHGGSDLRTEARAAACKLEGVLTNLYRLEAGAVWERANACWSEIRVSPELRTIAEGTGYVFLFELSFAS